MRKPFLYSIARFAPYCETGEFANVGVVVASAATGDFAYRLLTKRYARVTRFFSELDRKVITSTLKGLDQELNRVKLIAERGSAALVLEDVLRPRETLIKFSAPRVALADNAEELATELFANYVNREFVTPEYREAAMERAVRVVLEQADLNAFRKVTIGDEIYKIAFPFVKQSGVRVKAVIKPLFLGQKTPTKIINHGNLWRSKVEELRVRKVLRAPLFFRTEGPNDDDPLRKEAFEATCSNLAKAEIQVARSDDDESLVAFASAA